MGWIGIGAENLPREDLYLEYEYLNSIQKYCISLIKSQNKTCSVLNDHWRLQKSVYGATDIFRLYLHIDKYVFLLNHHHRVAYYQGYNNPTGKHRYVGDEFHHFYAYITHVVAIMIT